MIELYYCKVCREFHEYDTYGLRSPCKVYKPQVVNNDYMVQVVKELATELTRKSNVSISRMANKNGDRK